MAVTDEAASEAGRALIAKRWGDRVLRRAAATVLERGAGLADSTRADLEQIAGDPARDGDE
jgi:hypothetical protein